MAAYCKRIAAVLLVLVLTASLSFPAQAAQAVPESYIRSILNYYQHYGQQAQTDIDALLSQMAAVDWRQAAAWEKIIDNWTWAYTEMEVSPEILPDGLPEDDSLCIVALGYKLTGNGGMQRELEERMKVVLRSAEKYPDAYILCSGGSTSDRGSVTEAQAMAKWLTDRGIDPDRVIREDRSMSTTENALNSYDLLRRYYPQIKSVAIVTSDYHIYRSCMMFNAASLYGEGCHGSRRIDVVGNAVCTTQKEGNEGIYVQAQGLAILAGVGLDGLGVPALSRLTQITAEYDNGFHVTAHYDSGISRDISESVGIAGFDPDREGRQEVTLTYVENGIAVSESLSVIVEKPAAEAAQQLVQKTLQEPVSEPSPVGEVLAIAALWLGAVIILKWRDIL